MSEIDLEALAERERLRENVVHGLRLRGWSRIDAENEADDRLARAALSRLSPPNEVKHG